MFFKYQVSLSSVPIRLVKLPNGCHGTGPPTLQILGRVAEGAAVFFQCVTIHPSRVNERHACSVSTTGVRYDRGSGLEGEHRDQPAASGAPGEADPRGAGQPRHDSPPDRHQPRRVLPQTRQHRGQDHEAQRDHRGPRQRHGRGGQPWCWGQYL